MVNPADDHFTDHLADAINFDLFEPWREIDAWITSFCPCSLELSGTCSPKQSSRADAAGRVRAVAPSAADRSGRRPRA